MPYINAPNIDIADTLNNMDIKTSLSPDGSKRHGHATLQHP